MSQLMLNAGAAPSTPAAGKVMIFEDSADKRVKSIDENGFIQTLSSYDTKENLVINGDFRLAQRQNAVVATTYSNTTGRSYGPDRWGITNENASVTYKRINPGTETNLGACFYGKLVKITAPGKMILSQVIESFDTTGVRGRKVRLQCRMKYSIAPSMTVRLGLLSYGPAVTPDVLPATFVSAFGAVGVDPTWGTNLTALTPTVPDGGTISGNGLTCVLTNGWVRYSAVFTVPASHLNIVPVIWTNGQPAINDELNITEVMLFDGQGILDYTPQVQQHVVAECQRFYNKSFPIDTLPAQTGGLAGVPVAAAVAGAVAAIFGISWPVRMRVAPTTVTFYNPGAANAFVRNILKATDATVTTAANGSDTGTMVNVTGLAAWAAGDGIGVHYTADAEI